MAEISSDRININPETIIKRLNLRGDGNSGDTSGDKQRRQLRQELEGMKKAKRIEWLKEHFSQDPVWNQLS